MKRIDSGCGWSENSKIVIRDTETLRSYRFVWALALNINIKNSKLFCKIWLLSFKIVNKSKLVIVLHYYFERNDCRNNYSFIQSFHIIFSLIHLNQYYVNDFFIKMSVIYCVRFQIVCGWSRKELLINRYIGIEVR